MTPYSKLRQLTDKSGTRDIFIICLFQGYPRVTWRDGDHLGTTRCRLQWYKTSVSDPYSIESGSSQKSRSRRRWIRIRILAIFLTQFSNNIELFHNNIILSSIERHNVVKSKIILCWFNILDLFLSHWIRIRWPLNPNPDPNPCRKVRVPLLVSFNKIPY